jgi:hypothetical protein
LLRAAAASSWKANRSSPSGVLLRVLGGAVRVGKPGFMPFYAVP